MTWDGNKWLPKTEISNFVLLMYVQHSSVEWRERQLPCASRQEVNGTPVLFVGDPGFNSWPEGLVFQPKCLCFSLFFQGVAGMVPRTMPWTLTIHSHLAIWHYIIYKIYKSLLCKPRNKHKSKMLIRLPNKCKKLSNWTAWFIQMTGHPNFCNLMLSSSLSIDTGIVS